MRDAQGRFFDMSDDRKGGENMDELENLVQLLNSKKGDGKSKETKILVEVEIKASILKTYSIASTLNMFLKALESHPYRFSKRITYVTGFKDNPDWEGKK